MRSAVPAKHDADGRSVDGMVRELRQERQLGDPVDTSSDQAKIHCRDHESGERTHRGRVPARQCRGEHDTPGRGDEHMRDHPRGDEAAFS